MKLALRRGVSHQEFLETTSAREVAEYRALNLIDPIFDGSRIENMLAALTSLQFNMQRDPDKAKATSQEDWLPDYAARILPQKEVIQEDLELVMDQWLDNL